MNRRAIPRALLTAALLLIAPLAVASCDAPAPETAMANPAAESARGGFVHSVFFWLRPDLTAEQRDAFVQGLQELRGIETVQHGWIGVPAPTDRPIIDRSYSYALTVVFADEAAHEAYQVHPDHDRFREQFGEGYWTRVQIYDSVE
jgi:hypothetical protein